MKNIKSINFFDERPQWLRSKLIGVLAGSFLKCNSLKGNGGDKMLVKKSEDMMAPRENPYAVDSTVTVETDEQKAYRICVATVTQTKKVVALLNCSIITGGDGIFTYDEISSATVKHELDNADIVISAIGHESTAKIMSELLGCKVPVNRIKYEQLSGEVAIVFQLNKRPPEGKILSYEEIEKIGYTWKKIRKYRRNIFT